MNVNCFTYKLTCFRKFVKKHPFSSKKNLTPQIHDPFLVINDRSLIQCLPMPVLLWTMICTIHRHTDDAPWCYAMSCHVTSPHLTSPHLTSHHITSCHFMSCQWPCHMPCHATPYHITSHHVTSCHVTSHHVMSCSMHVHCSPTASLCPF